jgi:RNA polymerase sigma-70 factor (ECF subfamily)
MDLDENFEQALAEARAGGGAALGKLFRDLHPRILRYLRVLEPSQAEDLAADAWLDIATGLGRFTGDEHALVAWSFTIARRRLIDLQRRRVRRPTVPLEPEDIADLVTVVATEDEAIAQLTTDDAIRRLATLPPDQAEVILLRVLGGLAVQEVARIVEKRPGTVRVLQHRALRRLAQDAAREKVTE